MEKSHKQLAAWRTAMDLAKEVYAVTKLLPREEQYGLSSQMKRAAVSVPSNIAEGSARSSPRDGLHFFVIARGSLSELDTQLILCQEIGFLSEESCADLRVLIEKEDLLLSGLIRHRRSLSRDGA